MYSSGDLQSSPKQRERLPKTMRVEIQEAGRAKASLNMSDRPCITPMLAVQPGRFKSKIISDRYSCGEKRIIQSPKFVAAADIQPVGHNRPNVVAHGEKSREE